MTDLHDEYGEILRRTLHAEAETVVPAADGLDRIRTRISERPPSRFGWSSGWSSGWSWFTASWARPAMAGATALVMAAVVVSAPPAISSFTVGGHGAPDQGKHGENSTSGGATAGGGGQPIQVPPGQGRPQGLSPTRSRAPSPTLGGQGCGGPIGRQNPVSASDTPHAVEQPRTCEPPLTTTSASPSDSSAAPVVPPPPSSPPPEQPPTSSDQPLNQVDP